MGKSLFALLLFAFNLAAIAPTSARAATLYGGGYVSVGVPDLEQAVAFFQDVLDCRLIGPESAVAEASSDDAPASRLLSCDAGSVVELFDNRGISPSPASGRAERPLQFVSDAMCSRPARWLAVWCWISCRRGGCGCNCSAATPARLPAELWPQSTATDAQRRARKNSRSMPADSSASRPPATSMRWLWRASTRVSKTLPAAPVLGSAAA